MICRNAILSGNISICCEPMLNTQQDSIKKEGHGVELGDQTGLEGVKSGPGEGQHSMLKTDVKGASVTT